MIIDGLLPEMHRVLRVEGTLACGRQFLAGYPIPSFCETVQFISVFNAALQIMKA